MAVYTYISDKHLNKLLQEYFIGEIIYYKHILRGVENTNYIIKTTSGRYVLTLYEKNVNENDLPFFMRLLTHLGNRYYPCPRPIVRQDGEYISRIAGRNAAIFPFLPGQIISNPNPRHCAAVGNAIAKLHLITKDFQPPFRYNNMGLSTWEKLLPQAIEQADKIQPSLGYEMKCTLQDIKQYWPKNLPSGICHTDLFTDNVLFNDTNISGVIDFYFSCYDYWLYDLSVCLNDWCFSSFGNYYYSNSLAMIHAYHQIRPLTISEYDSFMLIMQASALRFLLTRLYQSINKPINAIVKYKNPMEYARILRFLRAQHSPNFFGLTKEMVKNC